MVADDIPQTAVMQKSSCHDDPLIKYNYFYLEYNYLITWICYGQLISQVSSTQRAPRVCSLTEKTLEVTMRKIIVEVEVSRVSGMNRSQRHCRPSDYFKG